MSARNGFKAAGCTIRAKITDIRKVNRFLKN